MSNDGMSLGKYMELVRKMEIKKQCNFEYHLAIEI